MSTRVERARTSLISALERYLDTIKSDLVTPPIHRETLQRELVILFNLQDNAEEIRRRADAAICRVKGHDEANDGVDS